MGMADIIVNGAADMATIILDFPKNEIKIEIK